MATSIFKQQCPTCEAMVPIKDRGLVGKKIDCPKCKARFVVEDPDAGAEDDKDKDKKKGKGDDKAAAKGKDKAPAKGSKKKVEDDYEDDEEGLGRPKRKAKKGEGNTKMMVGIGLAVLAVGLLGVAGFFMFGTGESKTGSNTSAGGGAAPEDAVTEAPPETKPETKSAPAAADVTNLLPADTEVVVNLASQDIFRSSLGKVSGDLASLVEQKESWEKDAGLTAENVERAVMALGISRPWSFIALRTSKPIKFDIIRKELDLKPAEPPSIRGQDYFTFKPFDLMKKAPGMPQQQMAMLGLMIGQKMMAVRLHDDQTLLFADLDPLKKFLEGGGKPEERPKEAPAAPQNAGAVAPMPGDIPGTIPAGIGGGIPGTPPVGAPGAAPAAGGVTQVAVSNSYQSLNPRLKSMLDKMEAKPFLLSIAADLDVKLPNNLTPGAMFGGNPLMAAMKISTIGFAVQAEGGLGVIAGVECKDANTSTMIEQLILGSMNFAIQQVHDAVALEVDWVPPLPANPNAMPGGIGAGPGMPAFGGIGQPPGVPGAFGPPGAGGAFGQPNMQGGVGAFPAGGGFPNLAGLGQPEEKLNGKLTVTGPTVSEQTIIMSAKIDSDGFHYLYDEYVLEKMLLAKGAAEMLMKHPQLHDLALAAKSVADQTQFYPRGTYDRPQPPGRNLRPWLPDQRVSWLADTLPFLGYGELQREIAFDKSWRDPANKRPAMTIVPFFLNPAMKNETWSIFSSAFNKRVAASHYVGVAGVGLDAADYPEKDPASAKKRGMFGYDRKTPLTEPVDGGSTTIMILQIPPETRGPWLAGGGSTVRGVPETKSVQPFVSMTHNGQKGTMAGMADGSARFIPENISDKVFQQLCVVEKSGFAGVDETTLVPRQAGTELKTAPPIIAPPPSAKPPAAAPEPKPPIEAAAADWQIYTSKADKFMVLMPGPTKEDKKTVPTPLGNVESRIYDAQRQGLQCQVICNEVSLPPGQEDAFFSNFAQLRIAGEKGTAQSEKKISLGQSPGREWEAQFPGTTARVRAYLVNGRSYGLMITTKGTSAEDIDRFFNSFKLLN